MLVSKLVALRLAVVAALACAAFPLGAQDAPAQPPDTRPTVAVMYFNNGAIGEQHEELAALGKGIAGMLITELSGNSGVRVIERDQLQKLLDEQNLSATDRVDQETAVRIGRVLGAQYMIFGNFVTDPRRNMRLDARAVNVETSRIEYTDRVAGRTDDLFELVARLAQQLNSGMNLPEIPRQARQASSDRAKKLPFQAAMLYSRGLSAQDQGDREQAMDLYRAVLEQFPEHDAARRQLAALGATTAGG